MPELSRKGTWRNYSMADGLPGLQTEHIAEDADGYLWIGTWDGGASRFDGDVFRTFTTRDGLSGNQVQAIHLDRQGRLWFGTDGGVCWYDGKIFHRFDEGSSVSNRPVQFLFEDREGCLWFGGDAVLGYYDGTHFHDLIPEFRRLYGEAPRDLYGLCWGIAQDGEGHLWFAYAGFSEDSPLLRYDGERFHRYGEEEGLPATYSHAIAQDADETLWIGAGLNLWRYDGRTFQLVPVELKGIIRKIQHDREGRTWFCTQGEAVCYDGEEFHHFSTRDGLAYDMVNGIFQDREGQIWFATWGGGLSCYDPHSVQILGESEELPMNMVSALVEDHRGRIWMQLEPGPMASEGVRSGIVACYDGENLTVVGEIEGWGGGVATIHEDSNHHLWFGGLGLTQWDGKTLQKMGTEEGLEGIGVSAIAEDLEGNLFFGHWKDLHELLKSPLQLTLFDGQRFQTLLTQEKVDEASYISALVATRRQEVFFGLGTSYDRGKGAGFGRWHETEGLSFYTVADGLLDDRVTDLIEDREGHLWITTFGGISHFDGTHFQNFTVEDGLPSDRVSWGYEDQQGYLWFGVEGGVVRYDGQVFQTVRVPEIAIVNDLIQDRRGQFWLATANGAVHYTPGQVPPKIRLLQTLADQVYQDVEEIRFSTSTRQVVFEYKGMSFRTYPRDMLYTCRLQGYEDDWQPATRERRAYYRDLPPGEYTFQVRAIDRDLNYSAPAQVRLNVTRSSRDQKINALEQRVRERTAELEQKNRQLEAGNVQLADANRQIQETTRRMSDFLARMSHDLRTPMNAIIGYTRILLRRLKDTIEPRQLRNLENIDTSSHNLLNLINEILDLSRIKAGRIDVNPQDVDLRQLAAECAASVESLIKHGVELIQRLDDVPITRTDPEILRKVLMNLLSNAVKFTDEGRITVGLQPVDGQVVLSVADTGMGIPAEDLPHIFEEFRQVERQGSTEKEGTGLGLAIAKMSVELLGGTIEAESEVGKGTTFTLKLRSYES